MTFTLEYWQDEGWYVGRLKEVAGVTSRGETLIIYYRVPDTQVPSYT